MPEQDAPKTATQAPAGSEETKLSPAELKKRAKAEKQARRAAQKEHTGGEHAGATPFNGEAESKPPRQGAQQDQKPKGGQAKGAQGQPQQTQKQGEKGGQSEKRTTLQQNLAHRRHPSQSIPVKPQLPKKENKDVELFSHLYAQPRRHNAEGVSKDVHPAVLALGFQYSSYEICGSSARCIAMLLAFKEAIQAYTVPSGIALGRHLPNHYLGPQIDYLKACRPMSQSMANAIRWLKKIAGEIDPNMPDHEAKQFLCEEIDRFVRERITVTDTAIASSAHRQIKEGSVVLTFAKSSIVQQTILRAYEAGTRFRVIVLDSRPLFEGRHLATSLMHAASELQIEYLPYSGLSHAAKEATLVLLGAHSLLSNGRLQSRVGTASVAMQAHRNDVPVIVLCESVKFSDKVALDSIVLNEVAPSEELLLASKVDAAPTPAPTDGKEGKKDEDEPAKLKTLADWRDIPNLKVLNLMYDVTPAEYISMVICEYGSVPPSSVPVVHDMANGTT
jgi:translation initiation factor eIF-2B subunit delta